MSGPTTRLLVGVDRSQAVIRPCGRASFTCGADFRRLVFDLYDKGCRDFVLELSECTIMDSTFLGILVRFAGVLAESGDPNHRMTLRNPSPKIIDLVTGLGMVDFFRIDQAPTPEGPVCKDVTAGGAPDKVESAKTALDAHKALMEANPDNQVRFKDVTRFLAEDLKRLGGS